MINNNRLKKCFWLSNNDLMESYVKILIHVYWYEGQNITNTFGE